MSTVINLNQTKKVKIVSCDVILNGCLQNTNSYRLNKKTGDLKILGDDLNSKDTINLMIRTEYKF